MLENSPTNNPNMIPALEAERQAATIITGIIDNPESLGANAEDGSYSKEETGTMVTEAIDLGVEHVGVKLRASRIRDYDPELYREGKFGEVLTIYTSIPGMAQLTLVMSNGKMQAVEYGDPSGMKNNDEGLSEALAAIDLAVEQLKPSVE